MYRSIINDYLTIIELKNDNLLSMYFKKKFMPLLCLDMHDNFQLKKSFMNKQIFNE